MLREQFAEGQCPATPRLKLACWRMPFVPSRNWYPIRPDVVHHEHDRQETQAEKRCDHERAAVEPEFSDHHSSTFVTKAVKRARFARKPKVKSPSRLFFGWRDTTAEQLIVRAMSRGYRGAAGHLHGQRILGYYQDVVRVSGAVDLHFRPFCFPQDV